MKRTALLLSIIIAAAVAASAQGLAIGSTMDNFSLPDASGKAHTFADLKGSKGAVVIFLSSQCPVVAAYNTRINQLATDYAAKGINFIGINSNVTESPDEIMSHANLNYKFPMLLDKAGVLSGKLGATVTPEAYFVDPKGILLYHGAIDNDRFGRNITDQYLRTAFDLTLAGKKVERTSERAFGCSIKRG